MARVGSSQRAARQIQPPASTDLFARPRADFSRHPEPMVGGCALIDHRTIRNREWLALWPGRELRRLSLERGSANQQFFLHQPYRPAILQSYHAAGVVV